MSEMLGFKYFVFKFLALALSDFFFQVKKSNQGKLFL